MADQKILQLIIEKIEHENVMHAKKIRANLSLLDESFFNWANIFLEKYMNFIKNAGVDLDKAIKYYLNKVNENIFEMVYFFTYGKYRYSSFDEVNKRVYSNNQVMESYMYGLLLSQVLWKQHYTMFDFYRCNLSDFLSHGNYLEIGGGHGLFINEAASIFNKKVDYDLLDISAKSLEIAHSFIDFENVNYIHSDIFNLETLKKYHFISMGEVLEHVEDPKALLLKIKQLLTQDGKLFITTPTNAPDIDHIYLFNNTSEIRSLLIDCGFNIVKEIEVPTENMNAEQAHKKKVCVMYAAFLSLKN